MSQLQIKCDLVRKDALEAYFDCHGLADAPEAKIGQPMPMSHADAYKRRKLQWRAKFAVRVENALEIMREALADDGSYNEFTPELLHNIRPTLPVVLARENSVCMYILDWKEDWLLPDRARTIQALKCDEYSVQPDGSLRLWWD